MNYEQIVMMGRKVVEEQVALGNHVPSAELVIETYARAYAGKDASAEAIEALFKALIVGLANEVKKMQKELATKSQI